jgi:hypothetical protein
MHVDIADSVAASTIEVLLRTAAVDLPTPTRRDLGLLLNVEMDEFAGP